MADKAEVRQGTLALMVLKAHSSASAATACHCSLRANRTSFGWAF